MNKFFIIVFVGIIALIGYNVEAYNNNKYESLILRYLENEENEEVLTYSMR